MEDPVIKAVTDALNLFAQSCVDVLAQTNKIYISLDTLTTMQAVLLNGMLKGAEGNLDSKNARDAFLHIHAECRKTMTVVNKAFKDYAIKFGVTTIPGYVIDKVIQETRRQVKNQ